MDENLLIGERRMRWRLVEAARKKGDDDSYGWRAESETMREEKDGRSRRMWRRKRITRKRKKMTEAKKRGEQEKRSRKRGESGDRVKR